MGMYLGLRQGERTPRFFFFSRFFDFFSGTFDNELINVRLTTSISRPYRLDAVKGRALVQGVRF